MKINKQNQLRHSVAVVKRFLNNPTLERLSKTHNTVTDYCDFDYSCIYCPVDDFGYCGLRRSDISDLERMTKYCLPSFLKFAKKEMEKL